MKRQLEMQETWRRFLTGELDEKGPSRHVFGLLPSNPRCRVCHAPFKGIGGQLVRVLFGKKPSKFNPKLCTSCEQFVSNNMGGAEIELTMLFADIRGSTTMAEEVDPMEFTKMMNRFYAATMNVLVKTDAWINKLVGDEVIGLYIPGFAGPHHARKALEAARELLRFTGHARSEGPWIPIGVGIHTGVVFVGTVGSEGGFTEMTALGDSMNITARLVSKAGIGEVLASEEACQSAGFSHGGFPKRQLKLKGRKKQVSVRVLKADSIL